MSNKLEVLDCKDLNLSCEKIVGDAISGNQQSIFNLVDSVKANVSLDVQSIKASVDDSLQSMNSSLSDSLVSSADKVVDAINNSSNLEGLIFVGLISAFSAFLFNLIHWWIVDSRAKKQKKIDVVNNLFERISANSCSYWLRDYQTEDEVLSILIKTDIKILGREIKVLGNNSTIEKLVVLMGEIYDVATGEDFESMNKKKNRSIAATVASKSAEARGLTSLLS